jgi:hypothetical protein
MSQNKALGAPICSVPMLVPILSGGLQPGKAVQNLERICTRVRGARLSMPETKKSPNDKAESMAARRVSLAARHRTVADEEERSGFTPLADGFRGRALAIEQTTSGWPKTGGSDVA